MFLSAITVMNMLIGVLCEVVSEVARGEKDDNEIRLIKEHILVELMKFDDDGDGMVSKSELERVIRNPKSIAVFRSLDVNVPYLMELQKMLYPKKDARVPMKAIMELMLMCRGSLATTVKHMTSGQAFTRWVLCSEVQR